MCESYLQPKLLVLNQDWCSRCLCQSPGAMQSWPGRYTHCKERRTLTIGILYLLFGGAVIIRRNDQIMWKYIYIYHQHLHLFFFFKVSKKQIPHFWFIKKAIVTENEMKVFMRGTHMILSRVSMIFLVATRPIWVLAVFFTTRWRFWAAIVSNFAFFAFKRFCVCSGRQNGVRRQ